MRTTQTPHKSVRNWSDSVRIRAVYKGIGRTPRTRQTAQSKVWINQLYYYYISQPPENEPLRSFSGVMGASDCQGSGCQ